MLDLADSIQRLAIFALPFALGISCHESAHAFAALRLGDPTAAMLGRITLNPARHFDPAGVIVFVLTTLLTPFAFGWAKPVPIDSRRFSHPRRGIMISSLAGPAANFLLAILFALAVRTLDEIAPPGSTLAVGMQDGGFQFWRPVHLILVAGVLVNVMLCVFNLLPIPPLDGSGVLQYFLPRRLAIRYLELERYGLVIIVALSALGLLRLALGPMYGLTLDAVQFLTGLS